jgi:hypothetical protein
MPGIDPSRAFVPLSIAVLTVSDARRAHREGAGRRERDRRRPPAAAEPGTVVPESFTHGSSQQRMTWFMNGVKSGSIQKCNTFAAGSR